ncbi:maltotransferase domain-containing protein, partial [Microbacterium sp.]|uniref:maltotransferase domain-containing protein n=1 Tax=Microbacterium sp. TaxID=51671 RepID=UPI0035B2EA35
MASTQRPTSDRPWRSASALPLRPAREHASPFPTATGRIPLTKPSPAIPGEPYRPKAFNGEAVPFSVTAFREGHDRIGVHLRLHSPSGDESLHRVTPLENGLDRWTTMVAPLENGLWTFRFEAFGDDFLTWQHAADVKIEAGVDVELMRELGALLFDAARAETDRPPAQRKTLAGAAAALRDPHVGVEGALAIVRDPAISRFFALRPVMSIASQGPLLELLVERERAGVGSWYEFFPRSEGARRFKDGRVKPGNLRTARNRMPAVRDMGFDVLYIPPVHPIGTTNRKGRNNTLTAEPGDPGSPYG